MDLAKLTNGLALVKQGLDDLDTRIREELSICGQLRRKAAAQRQETQQLQDQVEEAKQQLFEKQDEHDDASTLLECTKQQTSSASSRKSELQDSIKQLQGQVLDLVANFEESSGDFCTRFHKCKLAEQQQSVEHSEQAAAAAIAAQLEQLQTKRQQLVQQQSAIKDLRQKIADSKTSIQDLKFQVASESIISNGLMLELEQAQHSGPAAQQLAKLKQEVSQREEELINQQCSTTAQEVELSRAEADVKQKQQEVARKKAELVELNKTITALGLPPVSQLTGPAQHTATNAANQQTGMSAVAGAGTGAVAAVCSASAYTAAGINQPAATNWAAGNPPNHPQHHGYASSGTLHTGPAGTVHPAAAPTAQQQQQQQARRWQPVSGVALGQSQHQTWPGRQLLSAQPTAAAPPPQPAPPPSQPVAQQQQYYVEEPGEAEQRNEKAPGDNSNPRSEGTIKVEEVYADASADIQTQAHDNLQLALVSSNRQQPEAPAAAAAAGGARKRPRVQMVVHQTVMTQMLQPGTAGAPGGVVRKRVVVQEVEERVPSRSGSSLVPSKRAVMIEETQHRLSRANGLSHEQQVQHSKYGQYRHAASTVGASTAAAAEYDPTDYLEADIAGPPTAATSIPDGSGPVYDAGASAGGVSGGLSGAGWGSHRQQAGYMPPISVPVPDTRTISNANCAPWATGSLQGKGDMKQWQQQQQAYNSLEDQTDVREPQHLHVTNNAYELHSSSHGVCARRQGVSAHRQPQLQQQAPIAAHYAHQQQQVMQQQRQQVAPPQYQYQAQSYQQQTAGGPSRELQPLHQSRQSAQAVDQYQPAAAAGCVQQNMSWRTAVPEPVRFDSRRHGPDHMHQPQRQPQQQHHRTRPSAEEPLDETGPVNGGRVSKLANVKPSSRKGGAKTGKGSKGGKGSRGLRQQVANPVQGDDDGFGNGNDW